MGGSPESHEIYLVEYARQLPEAAILSVDYQLAPSSKFPSYLQEVFDAYQWVTSGTADVYEKLGYLPLDIIMTGDSCGMDTLMAMVCAINDIRKQWPNSEAVPPLPSAMCSAYATFVLSQGPYPSMMVAVFDCLLTPRTMTVAHNEFNPLGIETNGKHLDHNDIPDAVLAKQSELLVHPYWSPLFYKHFEDLKDIKLILLVTTVDHFGDTSVLMARQWRGPCELVVIEGEPHGFLHLNGISKSATVATNVMIDKLKTCLN
ncbi:hypothetical protein HDE_11266 [Halotydeus destructor]|nr:hypothetical protein HDE_11266 [Halotydeus destructor]